MTPEYDISSMTKYERRSKSKLCGGLLSKPESLLSHPQKRDIRFANTFATVTTTQLPQIWDDIKSVVIYQDDFVHSKQITMSWTGIRKAINRAGTQVMVKTGQIEQSHDPEYEHEERRFKQMEQTLNKLHKQLQSYLESLRILANAQSNIGEALGCFYGPNMAPVDAGAEVKYSALAHEYAAAMKHLNEQTLTELEAPYTQTVLNPVSKFNSYFVEVNDAIKKRHHKKLDYDAMKLKVKKLVENPQTNKTLTTVSGDYESKLEELRRQLSDAEAQFEGINAQLKQDLPKLVNLRTPFLDPLFELFVKIQMRFFNENYVHLNKLQEGLDARTREDYLNGRLEDRIDGILEKMRGLDIVGN